MINFITTDTNNCYAMCKFLLGCGINSERCFANASPREGWRGGFILTTELSFRWGVDGPSLRLMLSSVVR